MNLSERRQTLKGVGLMLLCVALTALAGAASKHIANEVSVALIVFAQYATGLLIVLPRLLPDFKARIRTERLPRHLFRSVCGWLCFYFYYLAIAHIPLVEASLLRSASPLCVPFVIVWLMGVKPPWSRWVAVLIGFSGIMLILKPESDSVNPWHFVGFLSAITLAISMVTTRQLTSTEPSERILFYYFLVSTLCSLPLMIVHWQPVPWNVWPWLLFIGLAIYIGLHFYTEAYRHAKASVVSPFSYFGVVFAGLLGWLIWQHVPDIWSFAGIALVLLGGILATVLGG